MDSSALSLRDVTTPKRDGGAFTLDVAEGYRQGRGAYGGLTLAALTRAVREAEDDPTRQLRTMSATLPAPTMGGQSVKVEANALRRGKRLSVWEGTMTQGDVVTARGTFVLGGPREVERAPRQPAPPAIPSYDDTPVTPVIPPMAPEFAQNFEFRNVGPIPFSGSDQNLTSGFIQHHRHDGPYDRADIVAMADTYWPTVLSTLRMPHPTVTIAFTLDWYDTEDIQGPLFFTAESNTERDGYSGERRELWTPDGRLVAVNNQTFVFV